jgi:glucose/arabinose dehydrogenase
MATRTADRSVVVDKTGALLVADDVGNAIWRVTPAGAKTAGN